MESRDIFRNLSPLDHRYYLSNKNLFNHLSDYLSEEAAVKYSILVEAALLETHIQTQTVKGLSPSFNTKDLLSIVNPEMVYEEEKETNHHMRALVNVIKRNVPDEINHLVHLGATSVDIIDTSASLRMKDVTRKVILPLLMELLEALIKLADDEAETPQVGRTHGQHAVPVTFGFSIAEYVARLGKSIINIESLSMDLRGKLAGAVGAYNASSLIVKDPVKLEREFLNILDLKPSEYATQMIEPEYLLRLLLEMNVSFGIIANLADDLRHLQRTEIDELRELFTDSQVGSSTMPQKRNPWNSEHVKSLWKAFSPRIMTFYMDQISEHQRDMSNSASSRFVADYISGFAAAAGRMKKIVTTIRVDRDRLLKNITLHGDLVLAEAAYVLLSVSGDADAHERVRKITLDCEKTGKSLGEELKADNKLWLIISKRLLETSGEDPDMFFSHPENYRGLAVEKTREITKIYKLKLRELSEILS